MWDFVVGDLEYIDRSLGLCVRAHVCKFKKYHSYYLAFAVSLDLLHGAVLTFYYLDACTNLLPQPTVFHTDHLQVS